MDFYFYELYVLLIIYCIAIVLNLTDTIIQGPWKIFQILPYKQRKRLYYRNAKYVFKMY